MGRGKKIGTVLILAGLCIPILAMLFADDYNSRFDLISNIQNTDVVIWQEVTQPPGLFYRKETIYIPCRYFFGLGIILTAIGIGLVIISKDGKATTE